MSMRFYNLCWCCIPHHIFLYINVLYLTVLFHQNKKLELSQKQEKFESLRIFILEKNNILYKFEFNYLSHHKFLFHIKYSLYLYWFSYFSRPAIFRMADCILGNYFLDIYFMTHETKSKITRIIMQTKNHS